VITQDRDFDERAKAGGDARVLRLTLGNAPPAALLAWLEQRWPQVEAWAGAREALLVLK
jgi:predicted nuclease of predicted toxin-antitoxin system